MFPPLEGSTNANEEKEQDIYICICLIITVLQIYRWKCNRFNEAMGLSNKTPQRFLKACMSLGKFLFCPPRIMYNVEIPTALLSIIRVWIDEHKLM
jgi:hypothetical protein